MLDFVTNVEAKAAAGMLLAALLATRAMTETIQDWQIDDVLTLMSRAQAEGRTGTARKTRLVDARPAQVGEIVVTAIKGEGKETQSPPAKKGDWVEERVNVRDDYKQYFEVTETPKPAGIAVLTDSDDTGSSAQGDYANFRACRH